MKQLLLTACVFMSTAGMAQPITLSGNATANFAPGTVVLVETTDQSGKPVQQVVEIPETSEMIRAKAQLLENSQTFKLNVNIEADENGENERPFLVALMKDAQYGWNKFNQNNTFEAPAGEYILQVAFNDKRCLYFDINLTEDQTLTVNADMATHMASAQMMLPNGEPMVMPTYLDGFLQDNPYNCSYMYVGMSMPYKNCSRAAYSVAEGRGGPEYYKTYLKMGTNVDNDDATLVWSILAVSGSASYGNIIAVNPADIPDDGIVRNDVNDYSAISAPFANTPAWPEDMSNMKCTFHTYKANNTSLSELSYINEDEVDYYLCAPYYARDSYSGVMNLEKMQTAVEDGNKTTGYGIITPAMARTENGVKYIDTQDGSPYNDTYGQLYVYQSDEYFSFMPYDGIPSFGASAPVCVTGFKMYTDKDWNYQQRFDLAGYYGNLGERLNVDRYLAKTTVSINGAETEFSDYQSFADWYEANLNNVKGKLLFKFTTDNILIDGIQGKNVCEVGFDSENQDEIYIPSVQRMMFRNSEGLPTNKIEKAEGSSINIAGAAFKFTKERVDMGGFKPTISYFTPNQTTLKVEIAPRGTEDFKELEMTIDESKYNAGYGYYWTGNIENLKTRSLDGWFDVRITMDNSDSEQFQVISPAFFVKDLMGEDSVANITADNSLNVIDGRIVAANGNEVEVFTLTGVRVNNNNLCDGIYIARSNGRSAKIMVK